MAKITRGKIAALAPLTASRSVIAKLRPNWMTMQESESANSQKASLRRSNSAMQAAVPDQTAVA